MSREEYMNLNEVHEPELLAAEYLLRAHRLLELSLESPDKRTKELLVQCAKDYTQMAEEAGLKPKPMLKISN